MNNSVTENDTQMFECKSYSDDRLDKNTEKKPKQFIHASFQESNLFLCFTHMHSLLLLIKLSLRFAWMELVWF